MTDVEYSTDAAQWLRDADPDAREQVLSRVERASDFPDHSLTRLTNSRYYKLRAGDYRAIIDWRREETPNILFVRTIDHRRNVYD